MPHFINALHKLDIVRLKVCTGWMGTRVCWKGRESKSESERVTVQGENRQPSGTGWQEQGRNMSLAEDMKKNIKREIKKKREKRVRDRKRKRDREREREREYQHRSQSGICNLTLQLSAPLSVSLYTCPAIYLWLYISVCNSNRLPLCPSFYLPCVYHHVPECLTNCLTIRLSEKQSRHLYNHPLNDI